MKVYLYEVGVLLDKDDAEYEFYSSAYDKKHGFYDEGQEYKANITNAIKEAREYVEKGVEGTYAIISKTYLDDDILDDGTKLEEIPVEDESYLMEDVVYSVAKINGIIVEDFLKTE